MARIVGYDPIVDGEQVGGPSAFFKLNGPGVRCALRAGIP